MAGRWEFGDQTHKIFADWSWCWSLGRLIWYVSLNKKGGGFIYFFHPHLGKILILTNIFQMGWNHQLENPSNVSWNSGWMSEWVLNGLGQMFDFGKSMSVYTYIDTYIYIYYLTYITKIPVKQVAMGSTNSATIHSSHLPGVRFPPKETHLPNSVFQLLSSFWGDSLP